MNKKSNLNLIISVILFSCIIHSFYKLFSARKLSKKITEIVGYDENKNQIGGDFELIDSNMKLFTQDNLKGKISIIYFGYTYAKNSPMHKVLEVSNTLKNYGIDVQIIFITVDPERDNVLTLKKFRKLLGSNFIALTGSQKQIKDTLETFKVYYPNIKFLEEGNSIEYFSFLYLIDKNGQYIKHFYFNPIAY